MEELAKLLIAGGVVLAIIGVVLLLSRMSGLGQLPGDVVIQRDNLSCFFPMASSILLSIVLTLILNLILRIISR